MPMKLSITNKVNVGFGLSLLLLLFVSVVSYRSIMKLVENSLMETHTYKIIAGLEDIISSVKDIETGSRGYIITGDTNYLEPYYAASAVIDEKVRTAARLTADNPKSQKMLYNLELMIHADKAFQAQLVELRRSKGYEVAKDAVKTDIEMYLMQEIRRLVHAMKNEEYALLKQRSGNVAASARNTIYVIILGSALAFTIVGIAIIIINRDIGERNKAEELIRQAKAAADAANRAKSEFLANMSHEIRTPMNAIIGMAEILSEIHLTERQKEYLDIFRRAGDNLLTLIDDILDLSKVEAGRLELEEMDFDLNETIEKVVKMLSFKAHEKGLELSYHISPDVPTLLSGDPNRLRQILVNLIGNAIKFADKGKVFVTVNRDKSAVSGQEKNQVDLQFSINDTGIGISSDKLNIIFDSFSQAHSSTSRIYGGTGLGLAITKRLVELMGGKMWVESRVGEGSTFYFTARFGIPVKTVERPASPFVKKTEVSLPEEQKPLNILLADDSEDNRLIVEFYLKQSTHKVESVENGVEAVNKFKTGQYDLVLMDMQMPVTYGYTATREIRRWEAETGKNPTPIIALTAYALKEEVKKSLDAGCNAHIAKPIKKATLLDAISQYARGVKV